MYSNHSFINVICSLKEKFKGFNDPSLKEDSLNKIPEIDRPFISKLNKIKKNRFDSVIKDLLDNLDFFDFMCLQIDSTMVLYILSGGQPTRNAEVAEWQTR